MNNCKLFIFFFVLTMLSLQTFSMTPNPIISRGKAVYTSGGNAPYLVDNKFGGSTFGVSNNSWIAINIGARPSKIFITWNDPAYAWSNELSPPHCPNNNPQIVDYEIMTSSNSSNGSDGQWTTSLSLRSSFVTARGHLFDFSGKSWVKIHITKGGGRIDEIEVFDASNGPEDVWFFAGTSISANTYKGTPPAQNFADIVNLSHRKFNPVMIRGGIGCISTTDMVRNLSKYLNMAGNAHFWAIEQGTNDAWGGSNGGVANFKKNLQIIIDSCKARNIQPILARTLATNQSAAGWQVHGDYLKVIDDLTETSSLVAGPDLYTWFLNHPGDLNNDGIHPNASGAANIQRLWAEKVSSLYAEVKVTTLAESKHPHINRNLSVTVNKGRVNLKAHCPGTAFIYTINGQLVCNHLFPSAGSFFEFNQKGYLLISFLTAQGTEKIQPLLRYAGQK